MQNPVDRSADQGLTIPQRAVPGEHFTLDCGSHSDPRWYVLQHQPARAETAMRELEAQGWNVWRPMRRAFVRHARRDTEVLRPVFPGYLFVQFDVAQDRWRAICSTRGVHRLFFLAAERPWPVRRGVIEALQDDHAAAGALDRPADSLLRAGATVRIGADTAFADQVGPVLRVDGGKVIVQVALFGRPTQVMVPARKLEVIELAAVIARPAAA